MAARFSLPAEQEAWGWISPVTFTPEHIWSDWCHSFSCGLFRSLSLPGPRLMGKRAL